MAQKYHDPCFEHLLNKLEKFQQKKICTILCHMIFTLNYYALALAPNEIENVV